MPNKGIGMEIIMHNELFTIGPVTIYGYGFMITIGIIAAYFNTVYLAKSAYAPNNVPLFPSQLVSSVFDFVHFFILCALFKRNKTPGKIGAFYLIFYSIGRFIIEFFRGDLERGSVGALSTSQFISIFIAIAGITMLFLLDRKEKHGGKR